MSTKFELAIVVLILLNMVAMAQEHYQQSQAYTDALDIMNIIFTTIFTLEALVKIIGMRWHYLRRAWNVFDLIIVILSVLGKFYFCHSLPYISDFWPHSMAVIPVAISGLTSANGRVPLVRLPDKLMISWSYVYFFKKTIIINKNSIHSNICSLEAVTCDVCIVVF